MENSPNCKCFRHAGLIRHAGGSKHLQLSAVLPELRPAPANYKIGYSKIKLICFLYYFYLADYPISNEEYPNPYIREAQECATCILRYLCYNDYVNVAPQTNTSNN